MGMTSIRTGATPDSALVSAASAGDEDAFAQIVEPYRGQLHAHCYRMLGSVYDADDALQETLLRAWRGLSRFDGRSALRSWLYTIATNVCLTQISRRPKRVLPIDYGPPTDPHVQPGDRSSSRSGSSPIRTSRSASRTALPRPRRATSSVRRWSSRSSPRSSIWRPTSALC